MKDHDIKVNASKIQKELRKSRFGLTEHSTRDIGKMENVMALLDLQIAIAISPFICSIAMLLIIFEISFSCFSIGYHLSMVIPFIIFVISYITITLSPFICSMAIRQTIFFNFLGDQKDGKSNGDGKFEYANGNSYIGDCKYDKKNVHR